MIEKVKVSTGVYYIAIPEAKLYLLAGSPADSVKQLMRMGLIVDKEIDGVLAETGPNAILLADTSIQNGQFSNLAEFPILQMFYRQGMIIPNHPNNTGDKPIIIGMANQVKAQLEYVKLGKFGILDRKDLLDSVGSEDFVEEIMRMKTAFSFGKLDESEELLETRVFGLEPIEIKNSVMIERKDLNLYELSYKGETVEINLNIASHEDYEPAVRLDFHRIRREYFSIIHVGEGDGWDMYRQCMGSVLVFQGRVYLIDTGPNITQSLTALGISVNEIDGVFHTHAHDDHFAGLPTLVRSDHPIKYYATPLVRKSVMKKLSRLMGIPESRFQNYFEIRDLEFDRWNSIEGLEVMPIFSPHPVETNIFYFRAFWEGGYKSYAHLADIIAFDTLSKMVQDKPQAQGTQPSGISQRLFRKTKEAYLLEANIKKIDGGGGMIHGDVRDFKSDTSKKIIIAHKAGKLSDAEKEIGSNATFGAQDVLIHSSQDYAMRQASRHLSMYFPEAPNHDLQMLLNCSIEDFNVGVNILRRGETALSVHLLLQGVVELIDSEKGIANTLTTGSFMGDYSGLSGEPSEFTFRASSYVKTLRIPCELYARFINRNYNYKEITRFNDNMKLLQTSRLFGDSISSNILSAIARVMIIKNFKAGDAFNADIPLLYLIIKGEANVLIADFVVEKIAAGAIWGEESVLLRAANLTSAIAVTDGSAAIIPGSIIEKIPIIEWKLLETYEKRITAFAGVEGFTGM